MQHRLTGFPKLHFPSQTAGHEEIVNLLQEGSAHAFKQLSTRADFSSAVPALISPVSAPPRNRLPRPVLALNSGQSGMWPCSV